MPSDTKSEVTPAVDEALAPLKPKLRGWLHAGWTPLVVIGSIVLILLSKTPTARIGNAVFLAGSLMLFGTSAIYHRGRWSTAALAVLRRLDHANIFVFIAASYTPMALLMLHGNSRVLLLTIIWIVGILGLLFRVLWLSAPRWLYVALYLGMGWAALGWLNQFLGTGGPLVFGLIIAGGLCYSLGAVAYARKRPNPSPAWFGFHEIFHLGTVLGCACHFVAILLLTLR
ncbi:PAQR family membrane homeostasis protein TrhA [Mariniluteicoccus flavus]